MAETPSEAEAIYTASQATNEALLLFIRKVRRLHPDAYADVIRRLPDGAQTALMLAENRADRLRDTDERFGIKRRYLTDEERYGAD